MLIVAAALLWDLRSAPVESRPFATRAIEQGEPVADAVEWREVAAGLWPRPDLAGSVAAIPLEPGDPITFTLDIANTGDKIASGVVVTDILPAEVLTPTFDSTLTLTRTGVLSYVWDVEPLVPGEDGVITITGLISPGLPSGFVMINRATIWDPEDSALGNNTDVVIVNGYTVYLPLTLRS